MAYHRAVAGSLHRSAEVQRGPQWRGVAARALPFLGIWGLAFGGFMLGVDVSQAGPAGHTTAARAYHALGLFVIGGLDLGMPVGGPVYARAMVWAAYFLAPLLTATALLEAALRMLAPLTVRYRVRNADIIIAGCGALSLLYLKKLREHDPGARVVVVERDPQHPRIAEAGDAYGAAVAVGDITSDVLLRQLRLQRVRRVMLLTGDDFANLDAAAKLLRVAPGLKGRIVTHVADLSFMRSVAHTSVLADCEEFNSHEFAAVYLVREKLLAKFQSTDYRDPVVLAGFGRFGQTVLHQLQELALEKFGKVVLVDAKASLNARIFAEHPGFSPEYDHEIIDGDLRDPAVWKSVTDILAGEVGEPVVIVGSGEDGTNLHTALSVQKRRPNATIIARGSQHSPFANDVSKSAGVQSFDLAQLTSAGMPTRWFTD